mmetsp:Transcript_16162/g.55221  ORF Transcript_16162/g.55221 Transcript_16162/m.55221 type:complete len:228 (+) Transcript_16162:872-1555(+)
MRARLRLVEARIVRGRVPRRGDVALGATVAAAPAEHGGERGAGDGPVRVVVQDALGVVVFLELEEAVARVGAGVAVLYNLDVEPPAALAKDVADVVVAPGGLELADPKRLAVLKTLRCRRHPRVVAGDAAAAAAAAVLLLLAAVLRRRHALAAAVVGRRHAVHLRRSTEVAAALAAVVAAAAVVLLLVLVVHLLLVHLLLLLAVAVLRGAAVAASPLLRSGMAPLLV